jgi:CRP-like cAMP-binding protein
MAKSQPAPAIIPATLEWTDTKAEHRDYRQGACIFAQGDPAPTVMYIAEGDVRLSVVSHAGKEAIIGLLERGHFFGEGCLVGHPLRVSTATAMSPSKIIMIARTEMIRVMHERPGVADAFLAHMVTRNIRIEEDLIDQLFNSTEKRLARTLLLLARYGEATPTHRALPKVSQELLAEMIGTTRTRVNFFMNKFRRLGFIEYDGVLKVNNSLLSVVLHD